jgi:hypothetical protein
MCVPQDLRTRLIKALGGFYRHEDFIIAYLPLLRELSTLALAPPPAIPLEPARKTRVLESKHPYDNNTKQTVEVVMHGAVKLSVSFDPQSRTETGCDYLVFYKVRVYVHMYDIKLLTYVLSLID